MSLSARLRVAYPDFDLALDLDAGPGEVVVLLGPNGAGKSTALRSLAGLQPELDGSVRLGDHVLDDVDRGVRVPPERRAVGVVFQDLLLFPHLSALENVAFGLRAQGMARDQARAIASGWLDRIGLGGHAMSRPGKLSGGQAQRVALARALAIDPQLLLLDEPLAALDASTRQEVRADLRDHLDAYEGVTILVTHDPVDALVLADRLIVVEGGRSVQEGSPVEVATAPQTDYVARLMGLNLLRGEVVDGVVRLAGDVQLPAPAGLSGNVLAAIPPSSILLSDLRSSPGAAGWPAVVERSEHHGAFARVHVRGPVTLMIDVPPGEMARLRLVKGASVWTEIAPASTHVYARRESAADRLTA